MAPTKAALKQSNAAVEAFDKYYSDRWGRERWQEKLKPALLEPTHHCALYNRFAPPDVFERVMKESGIDIERLAFPASSASLKCFVNSHTSGFPEPPTTVRPFTHWNLDAASLLPVLLLDIKPGDRVLDLCAAPGGKSLAMSQCIWPHDGGCLHANEFDRGRHRRLAFNLASYLPEQLLKSGQVRALNLDGTSPSLAQSLPFGMGGYDRVLVDAPCSSERHLLHQHATKKQGSELSSWRPGSSKNMAKVQASLLFNALTAVRLGGTVVYATCSIDQIENDDVVERALAQVQKKVRGWTAEVRETPDDDWSEKTKYGRICLPDTSSWGPLFFCVLHKIAVPA